MNNVTSIAKLNELLTNREHAGSPGLLHLKPADALDEMTNTLLDYRAFCKHNDIKLLSYLCEMAILEAIEVQIALAEDKPSAASDATSGEPPTDQDNDNDRHGGNDD